jgi:Ser/Thr protein kinase RdoA (MazF antagonist)
LRAETSTTAAGLSSDDRDVLDAWHIGAVHVASIPDSGTINRTLMIEAARGSYALREYRHSNLGPIEREHAIIVHACAQGLPAVCPIRLPSGETILERAGRFYALFPRAPGFQFDREKLTAREIVAMGRFLARVHRALRECPPDRVAQRAFAIDRSATLAGITRIEAAIQAQQTLDEVDRYALRRLAGRRAWIEQASVDELPDMRALDQQVIHGDYQETNLFFQDGQVVAIIDWDQTYAAARAWEAVRTLDLVFGFEVKPCRTFIASYRERLALDIAELDLAATCYSLMRAHDLWLYEAIYLEGNQRARRFIFPGDFVPLIDRWARLRKTLC